MEGQLIAILLADVGFVVITIFSVVVYVGRKLGKIDQHSKEISALEVALTKHLDKSEDVIERLVKIETKIDMTVKKGDVVYYGGAKVDL